MIPTPTFLEAVVAIVLLVWVMMSLVGVYTHDYTGFAAATTVMPVLASIFIAIFAVGSSRRRNGNGSHG